jgi:NAD(P) transhydrogenase subunit alpha
MIVGVVKETFPSEHRVAIVPAVLALLGKLKCEVLVESGAGASAGFADDFYSVKGAKIAASRREVFDQAQIICQVRTPSANSVGGDADLGMLRDRHSVIGFADPLSSMGPIQKLAATGARSFAMELMPRITRAQSMDVLSSQATVSGYKAVLLAAEHLSRMMPMMMTAAGTIPAAKVFVIGAGVAGLQAIASARKIGAVVQAYDVRPVVKEQVESLGAKFLAIELQTGGAEDKGGYAKAMDDTFLRQQRELMAKAVAESDVVITTAAVPGAKAPVLVTAEMVKMMSPGSVIVDLAAKPGVVGGNCEITRPDETFMEHYVTVLGPTNLPATVPQSASQMYAKNIVTFLQTLVKDGQLNVNMSDEVIAQTLLTEGGQIVNARVRELLGNAGQTT